MWGCPRPDSRNNGLRENGAHKCDTMGPDTGPDVSVPTTGPRGSNRFPGPHVHSPGGSSLFTDTRPPATDPRPSLKATHLPTRSPRYTRDRRLSTPLLRPHHIVPAQAKRLGRAPARVEAVPWEEDVRRRPPDVRRHRGLPGPVTAIQVVDGRDLLPGVGSQGSGGDYP